MPGRPRLYRMFELTAPPVLPFDVIEHILDVLFNDDTKGLQYVKNFSLVCHSFLPLCRKHIFSCISINTRVFRYDGEAFRQLLLESPDIVRYVLKLKIYIEPSNKHFRCFLSFPVSPLTRLQSLTISYTGLYLEWGKYPSSTQRSLLNLMHLPTLTHLDMNRISGFPISNLNTCTNIKHLFLHEVDIIDDEATSSPSWCRKSMKLQTLHISTETPWSIFPDIFRKIQQLEDLSLQIGGM